MLTVLHLQKKVKRKYKQWLEQESASGVIHTNNTQVINAPSNRNQYLTSVLSNSCGTTVLWNLYLDLQSFIFREQSRPLLQQLWHWLSQIKQEWAVWVRWTESWSSTIIARKDIVHAVLSSSLLKVSLTSATNTTSVALQKLCIGWHSL